MSQPSAIDINILISILGDHVDPDQKAKILKDIKTALKEEELDEKKGEAKNAADKPPKIEKRPVVVLTALPPGLTAKDLDTMVGFITEIEANDPIRNMVHNLKETMANYNGTKKAKKNPAKTLGELFEVAGLKLFKENQIFKKPLGPLEFIFIPNSRD